MPNPPLPPPAPPRRTPKPAVGWRAIAAGLAVVALGGVALLGGPEGLAQIADGLDRLSHHVATLGWAGPVVFGLVYALAVALSLPGAAGLTLAAGALFGTATASLVVILAATTGAAIVFLLARALVAGRLRARLSDARAARLETALREAGFSALLAARLLPLFPFWLVNLVPAVAGMRFGPYVAATGLGIIPGTVVYAAVGAGTGDLLAAGAAGDPALLWQPQILAPLIGLASLALAPALVACWRRQRRGRITPSAAAPSAAATPVDPERTPPP